jgi:hypothetical protein
LASSPTALLSNLAALAKDELGLVRCAVAAKPNTPDNGCIPFENRKYRIENQ